MALKKVHSGINLLKDFPKHANGFYLMLGDGYSFCTDLSKWAVFLNDKLITKQCSIYFQTANCVVLYTKTPFNCQVSFNEIDAGKEGIIYVSVPVTKIDTNVTVSTQVSLTLTQHLKILMADMSEFGSNVIVPTIPQPSSSDLAYYDVSEDGKKVKMEIYSGTIKDASTIFSCYVPVCDSTNTTAVPSDFVIDKDYNVGVKTMMGNLNSAKAVKFINDYEKEVDVVVLPQDNQLVDIDGKRYMLIRIAFWYDLTNQNKDNRLQCWDSYKVYLMFEN